MKLNIVLFAAGTLGLQFGPVPTPYIAHKFKDADGDSVEFYTSTEPTLSSARQKECNGKKSTLSVRIGVPNNGGAQDVFQGKFANEADAIAASSLIQGGVEDYAKAATAVDTVKVL